MISLIAAVALLQQESAEEAFARIEQTLTQAKSLSFHCRTTVAQAGREFSVAGAVLLKQGNKAKVSMTDDKAARWAVSNGKTVTVDPNQAVMDGESWATPEDLNARLSAAVIRKGFPDLLDLPRRIKGSNTDPREKLKVSGFKFGEKEEGLQTLSYLLQEGQGRAEVKLWYDPKDLTLRKRVMVIPIGPTATVTELYEKFSLNGDIPDDRFKP